MSRLLALSCLLFSAAPSLAQEIDPDTEIARRHFDRGTEHYAAGRYAEAVREFEAAREVKSKPAFDYNIGRCYDRLERFEEAVAAYQRYLRSSPDDGEAAELQQRIDVLKERIARKAPIALAPVVVAATPAPRHPEHPARRRWLSAGLAVGIVGVIAFGVGLGLYLGVGPEYDRLASTCAPDCARDSWSGLRSTEQAGIGLTSAGASLLAADLAVWVAGRKALAGDKQPR